MKWHCNCNPIIPTFPTHVRNCTFCTSNETGHSVITVTGQVIGPKTLLMPCMASTNSEREQSSRKKLKTDHEGRLFIIIITEYGARSASAHSSTSMKNSMLPT
jgi:hypothetical protein